MGKESDSPKPPDPNVVIPLQTEANLRMYGQALRDSRPNHITPFGQSTWSNNRTFNQEAYDQRVAAARAEHDTKRSESMRDVGFMSGGGDMGDSGPGHQSFNVTGREHTMAEFDPNTVDRSSFYQDNWENRVALSPEQQNLYNQTVAAQIKQAGLLSGAIDRVESGVANPENQLNQHVGEGARTRVEQAMFDRAMRMLNPEMQRQRSAQDTQLMQSGFQLNNPEFERLAGSLDDRQMGQRTDIANASILAGGQEQDRVLNNLIKIRQAPLNELASIRSGTQITPPGTQGTFSTPGLAAPDIVGAYQNQYEGQVAQHNADVASDNAMMSAIVQAAMAAATGGSSLALTAAGAAGGMFGGR